MNKIILQMTMLIIAITSLNGLTLNLDTNKDGKPDRWLEADISKDWKKFDFNKNDKADESFFYVSDKNIIYFIFSESFDYKGSGKANIWITNELKGSDIFTEIKADQNLDGKIDLIVLKKNDFIYLKKTDTDLNGSFDLEEYFDAGSNRKAREAIDTNKDGIMDDFYYFEKDQIIREEIDTNYDGKPDMWVLFEYNKNGSLKECIVQKDNNFDGKPDEWHYTDSKRRVIKVEKDSNFDGKIDYTKDYKNGK